MEATFEGTEKNERGKEIVVNKPGIYKFDFTTKEVNQIINLGLPDGVKLEGDMLLNGDSLVMEIASNGLDYVYNIKEGTVNELGPNKDTLRGNGLVRKSCILSRFDFIYR